MKSALRGMLSFFIVAGIIIALWPLGQTGYAHWSQSRLQNDWQQEAKAADNQGVKKVGASKTEGVRQLRLVSNGHTAAKTVAKEAKIAIRPLPPTRIIIPEIGVDAVMVQGMDESSLRRGPGHEPTSVLPGEPGNCIVAGHRNIYGSYFYKLDSLQPGSEIILRTPHASYSYKVSLMCAIPDSDLSPYRPIDPGLPQLTIVTCTLPHSTERLIVTAQMDQ